MTIATTLRTSPNPMTAPMTVSKAKTLRNAVAAAVAMAGTHGTDRQKRMARELEPVRDRLFRFIEDTPRGGLCVNNPGRIPALWFHEAYALDALIGDFLDWYEEPGDDETATLPVAHVEEGPTLEALFDCLYFMFDAASAELEPEAHTAHVLAYNRYCSARDRAAR